MGRRFIFVMLLLAGCNAQSQQTPEPNDTAQIGALIEQLGTQRSYNSKTLLMNPDPDGVILSRWLRRRQATLDGTLTLSQLPANSNPGSIADTLAWEREAKRKEAGASNALTHYMLDSAMRDGTCPQVVAAESEWYTRLFNEHRKGMHDTLVDWKATSAKYQQQCDAEKTNPQPLADAPPFEAHEQSEQACFDMQSEPGEEAEAFQARKNECLRPYIE